MKSMLKKFVALVAAVLFWSAQANAVLIEIVPSTVGPADVGDNFSVEVWARDLGGDYITAYDILVAFDASLLDWISITWSGCELGRCLGASTVDVASGWSLDGLAGASELSFLFDFEFPDFQDGSDFELFSIGFTVATAFDTTSFSFVWDEFHDVKCLANDPCFPTAVSEPGTLALLGLGLLGLAISRRRFFS